MRTTFFSPSTNEWFLATRHFGQTSHSVYLHGIWMHSFYVSCLVRLEKFEPFNWCGRALFLPKDRDGVTLFVRSDKYLGPPSIKFQPQTVCFFGGVLGLKFQNSWRFRCTGYTKNIRKTSQVLPAFRGISLPLGMTWGHPFRFPLFYPNKKSRG